jgi:transcriptional regulator with XRE-family HTH domain
MSKDTITELEVSELCFPRRLRNARKNIRKIRQTDLAEKANLPPTSISHFEKIDGTRKPSFANLKKIAKALDVTIDYLLGMSDDPFGVVTHDTLYRDIKNLTGEDRKFVERVIEKIKFKGLKNER